MDFASVTRDDGTTITSNHQTESELRDELAASAPAVEEKDVTTPSIERPIDRRTREGRKSTIQAELDELTATKRTTEREITEAQAKRDALAAELRDLETKRQRPAAPVAQPANGNGHQPSAVDDPEPKIEDFKDKAVDGDAYTPWMLARSEWAARQQFAKLETNRREREQQEAHGRTLHTNLEAMTDRVAKTLDMDIKNGKAIYDALIARGVRADVFLNPDIRPLSALSKGETGDFRNALAQVVLESDRPVEMMLELGKDEHLQRLRTLPPDAFYQAIGEIKQSLAVAHNGPIAKPVRLSAASKPTKPLGSSPVAAQDEPPGEDASEAEYEAYWAPRRKKVLRAR